MTKSKLIVLSADALVADDMELFKTLPSFKKYLSGGACVKTVKTCYPTITYPAHATIATGVYPDKHGVTGNDIFYPEPVGRPWCWFHESVKAKDIFSYAKEAGKTTAAVLERCDTVDEAPTFARILGTEIKDADGRILTELLYD